MSERGGDSVIEQDQAAIRERRERMEAIIQYHGQREDDANRELFQLRRECRHPNRIDIAGNDSESLYRCPDCGWQEIA